MQPQEAIKELSRLKTGRPTNDFDRQDKAIEMAKAAINKIFIKQEPDYSKVEKCFECPTCKDIVEHPDPHCPNCGQAILWSERE